MLEPELLYTAGGGGLVYIAQLIWGKVFSSEGKANDALVQQLTERIAAQEARLITLEAGLDNERAARRIAEDKVQVLEIDNVLLRAELSKHGIDIPRAIRAAKTRKTDMPTNGSESD